MFYALSIRLRFAPLAVLATLGIASIAHADDPVSVVTRQGRRYTGAVDASSNEQTLVLRVERPGIVMLRPIERTRIESIAEVVPPTKRIEPPKPPVPPTGKTYSLAPVPSEASHPSGIMQAAARLDAAAQLGSIAVEVAVANWDADVENDGLVITLAPIDSNGQLMAVDGTLDVELIAEAPGEMSQIRTFPVIGHWSRAVRREDCTPSGYMFRCEFQYLPPDFDLRLGNFGLARVRLMAPGYGSFESTVNTVTLRAVSPLRDRLQQQQKQRFFNDERTGWGRQPTSNVPGL